MMAGTSTRDSRFPAEAREHLDKYWGLARRFFQESDFALAAFFAITLIEEVGKAIIIGGKALGVGPEDYKDFRDHRAKYKHAVYSTLVVNSRVTRIYGTEEDRFARWFRDDELFDIRNRSLYLERIGSELVPPSRSISRDDAFLLVCIAGEVYADVQGTYTGAGPNDWQRIIDEVDAFRKLNGA